MNAAVYRLPIPLLSARPAVTFPVREHHRDTALWPILVLYSLVSEAHVCAQLAQSHYLAAERPGIELATSRSLVRRPNHDTTKPRKDTFLITHHCGLLV